MEGHRCLGWPSPRGHKSRAVWNGSREQKQMPPQSMRVLTRCVALIATADALAAPRSYLRNELSQLLLQRARTGAANFRKIKSPSARQLPARAPLRPAAHPQRRAKLAARHRARRAATSNLLPRRAARSNRSRAARRPAASLPQAVQTQVCYLAGFHDEPKAKWVAAFGEPSVTLDVERVSDKSVQPRSGQDKRAKFPTSKAPFSAVFHSFRLIFGRAIISRNGLEAWMLFPERARAEHSR